MQQVPFMRWIVCLTLFLLAGCDDRPAAPTTIPVAAPASPPATTSQPSSQPTRPPAVLMIDQQQMEFPPAVLRLRPQDDQLHPILSSDDPKEALNRDYTGNSFYIELPGRFTEAAELDDKPFLFVTQSSEREDKPTGIFLQGNRYQLQPSNVKIELRGESPKMEAWVSGTFLMFDLRDDTAPGRLIAVAGRLNVEVK